MGPLGNSGEIDRCELPGDTCELGLRCAAVAATRRPRAALIRQPAPSSANHKTRCTPPTRLNNHHERPQVLDGIHEADDARQLLQEALYTKSARRTCTSKGPRRRGRRKTLKSVVARRRGLVRRRRRVVRRRAPRDPVRRRRPGGRRPLERKIRTSGRNTFTEGSEARDEAPGAVVRTDGRTTR